MILKTSDRWFPWRFSSTVWFPYGKAFFPNNNYWEIDFRKLLRRFPFFPKHRIYQNKRSRNVRSSIPLTCSRQRRDPPCHGHIFNKRGCSSHQLASWPWSPLRSLVCQAQKIKSSYKDCIIKCAPFVHLTKPSHTDFNNYPCNHQVRLAGGLVAAKPSASNMQLASAGIA